MKKVIPAVIFLFVFAFHCHAQWKYFPDSAILDHNFSSIIKMNDGYLSSNGIHLYYSKDIPGRFEWKLVKTNCNPIEVLRIDSALFGMLAIKGNWQLIVSYDTFKTYTVLMRSNVGYIHRVGKRLIVSGADGYIYYSDNKGISFSKAIDPERQKYPVYPMQNDSILVMVIDSGSPSKNINCLVSEDGVHIQQHFIVSRSSREVFPYIFYQHGRLYPVMDSIVRMYDTSTHVLTDLGFSPGLEKKSFMVKDFWISGNTYCICYYNLNQFSDTLFCFYKSNDLRKWSFIGKINSNGGALEQIGPGKDLFVSDKIYRLSDDSIYIMKSYGIDGLNIISQAGTHRIGVQDDLLNQWINSDQSTSIVRNSDDSLKFNTLTNYILPSNFFLDGRKNKVIVAGNSISEDDGFSFRPLTLPHSSSKDIRLLGYNDVNIIVYDASGKLLVSSDKGASWVRADSGIAFDTSVGRYPGPFLLQYQKGYVLLVSNQRSYALHAYYIDTLGNKWESMDSLLWPSRAFGFVMPGITPDGTPFIINADPDDHYIYGIYAFDRNLKHWIASGMKNMVRGQYFILQDKIFMLDASRSLFISSDLGNTFSLDSSFPAIPINSWYTTGVLDTTIFISTPGGIYTNNTFLKEYETINPPVKKRSPGADTNNRQADTTIWTLKVIPNPVIDNFRLQYYADTSAPGYIQITDMSGQVCRSYSVQASKGNTEIILSREGLRKGMYILQLKTTGLVRTQKIVME